MLEAVAVVEHAVGNRSVEEYESDRITRFAVERAIEIVSDASRRISDELLATQPEIEWKKVRGIGNILRHEYHGLSETVIWGVIVDELPRLRSAWVSMREAARRP
ncbi:HepT-like ribonuclease domain-containing protein [Pseudorhizobium tarimense]|uniref:HepT-like ribonuclease domain-containing protein n=1 Tax=Pseudorhizobium tarimense TaxID=1079109 RepID=UPI001FF4D2F8|nr:HepT-like ribonuclease domain-containing protein [Pseudorhizobium tarimense]MCJ8517510.1 DUF86 domain-containing protein [Pseudorhizobium tarimense]